MSKRKVLGYFYKDGNKESLSTAFGHYSLYFNELIPTLKSLLNCIKFDVDHGISSPRTKKKIYRVVLEEVNVETEK